MSSALYTESTDPFTINHLLTLPQLLHPISPSLAALHLARIRLLLSVPARSTPGWCNVCGGLREGYTGKAVRGKGKGKSISSVQGRKKGSAVETGLGDAKRSLGCGICGAKYGRVKPDPNTLSAFPAARRVVRTRQLTRSQDSVTVPNSQSLQPSHTSQPPQSTSQPSEIVPAIDLTSTQPTMAPTYGTEDIVMAEPAPGGVTPDISIPTIFEPPEPVVEQISPGKLTSRPSLSYMLSTDPNPPTYPIPPPSLRASSPPKPKAGIKKKKKSGLAKLLAESKEREERDKGSGAGSWGF